MSTVSKKKKNPPGAGRAAGGDITKKTSNASTARRGVATRRRHSDNPAPESVTIAPKPSTRPKPPGGLSPLELQAIAILGKEAKKYREFIQPGLAQPLDFFVRIDGTVDVASDQQATIRTAPKAEDVLATVFDQLGPKTTEKIVAALAVADRREPTASSREQACTILNTLTVSTPQKKSGNVTGTLHVSRMG